MKIKELFEAKSADKESVHPWAVAMLDVVKTVSAKVAREITGAAGSEGTETPKATGKKIIDAFKEAGYKPFEQIDDFWLVKAKGKRSVGISIDYREDMEFTSGKCHVMFYDENM